MWYGIIHNFDKVIKLLVNNYYQVVFFIKSICSSYWDHSIEIILSKWLNMNVYN